MGAQGDGIYVEPVGVERLKAAREQADRWQEVWDEKIQAAELGHIEAWRRRCARTVPLDGDVTTELAGLAISGGGIRSATFSLGVMQALAAHGLLKHMDYLSTVSGGGYSGSMLTWLLSQDWNADPNDGQASIRFGPDPEDFPLGVQNPMQAPTFPADDKPKGSLPERREAILKHLREHGKYLVPGEGITLTSGIAIVLRGVLLNLLVWMPIFALIFLGLLMASAGLIDPHIDPDWRTTLDEPYISITVFNLSLVISALSVALFAAACAYYSLQTWAMRSQSTSGSRYKSRRMFEDLVRWLLWITVGALLLGSIPWAHELINEKIADAGGPGMLLLGIASGLWGFVKSEKGNGGVPLGLVASGGAALLLYGVLLSAFQLAVLVIGSGADNGWVQPAMALVVFLAFLTGWFVNLNYISLHRFYRDRLMETFMPDVSHAGETKPAQGADTAKLSSFLREPGPCKPVENGEVVTEACGPYHIVNTNLVLVDSKVRRYRIRGGDNFILAPAFCGSNATGWRTTEKFIGNGMTLSTAMAISGAAANPHAGVGGSGPTRSPLVSLLMALMNFRLGYWARHPNPNLSQFLRSKERPRANHFHPGAKYEIFNLFRENRLFVHLSDGGHFENLALYELIRRRLKLIVLCDGGADPNFDFADLQTALRRIEEDFGVQISFDGEKNQPSRLIPLGYAGFPKDAKCADAGHIVGTIHYPGVDEPGTLVFLKTTMVKNLSLKVQGYKGANRDFPDQSTADQFFDEQQFEAYRELGYAIAAQMIEDNALIRCRELRDGQEVIRRKTLGEALDEL